MFRSNVKPQVVTPFTLTVSTKRPLPPLYERPLPPFLAPFPSENHPLSFSGTATNDSVPPDKSDAKKRAPVLFPVGMARERGYGRPGLTIRPDVD